MRQKLLDPICHQLRFLRSINNFVCFSARRLLMLYHALPLATSPPSRWRRYLSRPYMYPLFFVALLFLLIRWNGRRPHQQSGVRFDHFEEENDIMLDYSGQDREDGKQHIDDKHVIKKPPLPDEEGKKVTLLQKKSNTVYLTVYMEAQCPDTTGFIRRQLLPAWSRLGSTNRVNVTIVPFGKASCVREEEDDFRCECQHGKDECELNQLMNCAMELLPEPDSFVPLIGCIQGKDGLTEAFKSCLDGHSSSDWLWQCATGKRGRLLLAQAGNRTSSLGPSFNFVPWVVLNGRREQDAFYALEENLCKRLREPSEPVQCVKFSRNGKSPPQSASFSKLLLFPSSFIFLLHYFL